MSIDWENKVITVSAAIILNDQKQILVARKKNTEFYMQIGGKLETNETPQQSLLREIEEEILVKAKILKDFGCIDTQAANEADFKLKAYLFYVELFGEPQACAEIADIQWIDVDNKQNLPLAPLTAQFVLPLIKHL